MKISYTEKDTHVIDIVAPLWQKLLDYHISLSEHFSEHFRLRTWAARKAELISKSKNGYMNIDIATDTNTGEIVGYSISTVSGQGHGELDSIYVESEYRHYGIGDSLMQRALKWMEEKQARTKILIVGAGNEKVFTFYGRYSFFPRSTLLEQKERSYE